MRSAAVCNEQTWSKPTGLRLRAFREEDIDALYEIQCDPDAMQYTFRAASRQDSARRWRAYAAQEQQLGFAPWTILLRSEARIIGWGGLNVDPDEPGWGVEVAYFFHPACWGQGFATELVRFSFEYGFQYHALPEIHAYVHPENLASVHVLKKCGFQWQCFEPALNRDHYIVYRDNR